MMAFRFAHRALSAAAIGAFLAGCGGLQIPSPAAPSFTKPADRESRPSAGVRGPLLYIGHEHGQSRHPYSIVSVLSLRQGRTVARITGLGYITGICSDPAGNVWIPNLRNRHWFVDEFARGSTKEIAELHAPRPWSAFEGCAVDPSSGNLAVPGANLDGGPTVLIWSGARAGKPAMYPAEFPFLDATYDNAGNLFISGWQGGSDFDFEMGELAKGASRVTTIKLDKRTYIPGDVQWDGQYIVVDTTLSGRGRPSHFLYRVQVSGSKGHVVQVVPIDKLFAGFYRTPLFVLHDGSVIGVAGPSGKHLRVWAYPGGGKPTGSIGKYDGMSGLAISQ
jgi:hypothetical protein